jgi:hypothetical protein
MNDEEFERTVNEVRERIGCSPACITKDICEFAGCKDKSWLHRMWHNFRYTEPAHLGAANTKTKRIWINPYLVLFGNEHMIKNTLAHEMVHLKIKKKRKGIDVIPLVKKLKYTKDKAEIIDIGKKIIVEMLDIQKTKIREESVTREIADRLYPVYKSEETNFFVKTFILHPKTVLETVFTFGTALAVSYAAQVVARTEPVLGVMVILAYLGLQLIIFTQKTRRL